MHQLTIAELVKGLRNKDFSSRELTQHYLERIARLDKTYNSYITVTPELALSQALVADKRIAEGNAPALCGVPIAHKDIFCTNGVRTTCASKMLENFIAPYNATIVDN
ncbi:MAG: Asp-tRNA(Asn)/Glu-tRNA(Gln) amidotransferase GatCAB subunit A, partial [Moraxellaceae bacterium]